jgi:hypothetical protein
MSTERTGLGRALAGVAALLVGGGCATWGGTFLLLGTIFVIVFPLVFGLPIDDLRLDRGEPFEVMARVYDVQLVPNTSIDGQAVYTVDYAFEAGEGEIYDQARVLGNDPVSRLEEGDELLVEVLPEDQLVSRPVGSPSWAGGWAGVIGLPFLALGLLVLLPALLLLVGGATSLLRWQRARQA